MTLYSDDDEPLYEIVWHPDGSVLAGVSEHTIKIWDAPPVNRLNRLKSKKR